MLTAEVESRHTREAIEEEIRIFEERSLQLRRGGITDDQFRPFRLKRGIYGQRQPGFQMVRVKIPSEAHRLNLALAPGEILVLPAMLRIRINADEFGVGHRSSISP